jgi:hypothetical protein
MSGDATTPERISPAKSATVSAFRTRTVAAAARVAPWLRANVEDLLILAALGALTILVVVLNLEGIGTGGDAIRKWHFVRQWFYANSFRHAPWDHHMARFGVLWVAYLVQLVAGRGPLSYYVPSLIAVSVQTMFVYACGKRLGGRLAGVLGAFLLIYFAATIRAGSQLMPEVFSGTYAIIAAYLYLRYTDAVGRKRMAWLAAMSVVLFVDYLGKETSVFFYPGFVLSVWLAGSNFRDRFRDLAVMLGVIALGVLVETASYHLFTDYSSRLSVIVSNRDFEPGLPKGAPQNFWQLFNRFQKLDEPWKVAFYTFLPIGPAVVAFAKNFRATALYAIVAGYIFFLTFTVRHLNPFAIWHMFRVRYFDPTAPFVQLMAGLFLALVLREIFGRYADARWVRRFSGSSRWGTAVVLLLVVLAGAGSYAAAAPGLEDHVLRFNANMSQIATDAYVRNLPIVSTRDQRATWVVYSVLIDDRLLARDRKLPAFEDVKIQDGDRWWLVKEPSKYPLDKLHRMLRARCVVEVTVNAPGPISQMRPMHRLPASCDRLAEE